MNHFLIFLINYKWVSKVLLIEYEDTLPLQGNLINVSINKKFKTIKNKYFFF